MKRLLTLVALAGLSVAAGACGDDSGDDGETPAATKDAGTDAVVSRGPQINADSLGDECTSAANCSGAGDLMCLQTIGMDTEIPGGYCTAQCNSDAECGPNGFCPAAAIASIPGAGALAGLTAGLIPQNCVLKCTKTNDAGGGCARTDQNCSALIDGIPAAFRQLAQGFPAATTPFCFPPVMLPIPDGGLGDGGAAAILGGLDSGL